jgi:hypothetical protein
MIKRKLIKEYKVVEFDNNINDLLEFEWSSVEEKRKYMTTLASEIGWIIIEFSSLENKLDSILNFYLVETSKNKEIIYFLLSKKRFSEKIDLFSNLLKINYSRNSENYDKLIPNFENELNSIVNNLKEASQIRNKYAHSIWSNTSGSKHVESQTKISRNGIEKVYMKFDYQDLDTDFNNLFDIGTYLSSFNEKILDSLLNEDK